MGRWVILSERNSKILDFKVKCRVSAVPDGCVTPCLPELPTLLGVSNTQSIPFGVVVVLFDGQKPRYSR